MATTKTGTLRVRVPTVVIEALQSDAAALGIPPGSLVRKMLEKRYSVPSSVGNSNGHVGKSYSTLTYQEVPDDDD